jgi:hypothetical protein
MLLYPLQEAMDLLESKLSGAKQSMEETIEDLEWLREQVTVMEVNFARVHNVSTLRISLVSTQLTVDVWSQWDVKRSARPRLYPESSS